MVVLLAGFGSGFGGHPATTTTATAMTSNSTVILSVRFIYGILSRAAFGTGWRAHVRVPVNRGLLGVNRPAPPSADG